MKRILIILVFSLGVLSCNNSKKFSDVSQEVSYTSQKSHPGKALMEKNCNICHSPSATHDNRLAPPMIAVKKRYINSETSQEEFYILMRDWLNNPNEKNAKMFGAVRKFGVMLKVDYTEEVIKQIADYIYNNEIEQPEWFDEHYNNQKGNRKGKIN